MEVSARDAVSTDIELSVNPDGHRLVQALGDRHPEAGAPLADQAARAQGNSRDEVLEAAGGRIPLGRLGTEAEIAAVITFLCSARASDVVGAAWSVDGGSVPSIV